MKRIAFLAVLSAIVLWALVYNQPYVVAINGCTLQMPLTMDSVYQSKYSVDVASGSNATVKKSDMTLVVETDGTFDNTAKLISIAADTQYTKKSDMSVYGHIKLGDTEQKVRKYYYLPTFDLGNNCSLYTKKFSEGKDDIIAIGVQDGKVVHIEVLYEDADK